MGLPVKTTLDDVHKMVDYLRAKPTGATLQDAKSVLGSTPLDARKVRAYLAWEIIKEKEDKYVLDTRGWTLARKPDEASEVFGEVIDSIRPYRGAIEWAYYQQLSPVTVNDVAAHWADNFAKELDTDNETTIQAAVTCFFNVAQGAGLGRYVLGRGSNPTRLELHGDSVKAFIESGPTVPPWHEAPDPDHLRPDEHAEDGSQIDELPNEEETARQDDRSASSDERKGSSHAPLRVFIAHGKNMDIVEQVETILGFVDIENEYAEAEESSAIPVPEKVMNAMRRCNAGIICVSVDEGHTDGDGNYKINENVLIEIGVAFVLYEKRVVLLWDSRLDVPSNLQGLYRCEYEGDELGWGAGTKLMKAVKNFRD